MGPNKKDVLNLLNRRKLLSNEEFVNVAKALTRNPDLNIGVSLQDPRYSEILNEKTSLAFHLLLSVLHQDSLIDINELYGKEKKKSDTAIITKQQEGIVVGGRRIDQSVTDFKQGHSESASDNLSQKEGENVGRSGTSGKKPEKTTITDYYGMFGVSPDASQEEIKRARNRLFAEENANTVEGDLRKNGLSTEEIYLHPRYLAAVQRDQNINEGYAILGNEKNRKDYDPYHKQQYPESWHKETSESIVGGVESFTIIATPTTSKTNASEKALSKTKKFTDSVKNYNFSLNAQEIENLKHITGINTLQNADILTGRFLIAQAIVPQDIMKLLKSSKLSSTAKTHLANAAIVAESIRTSSDINFQDLRTANQYPLPYLTSDSTKSKQNSITINSSNSKITSITQNYYGAVSQVLGGKTGQSGSSNSLNTMTSNAIQKGGLKALEKLGLKSLSTATKGVLGKILPLLAGLIPGIGTALAGILKLAPLFLGKILNKVRKFISDNKEMIALGGIMGGIFGSPVILIGAGGLLLFSGGFPTITAAVGGIATGLIYGAGILAFGAYSVITSLLWFFGTILIVTLIVLMTDLGAYVAPLSDPLASSQSAENLYMAVVKRPHITKTPNPITITYTISIEAKNEELRNIQVTNYTCKAINNNRQSINCPAVNPRVPAGTVISPGSIFLFTYTVAYGSLFANSMVSDTITLTADTPTKQGITSSGSASVCFGDCPEECPSIWPTSSGYITQGVNTQYTHQNGLQAIDIGGVGVGTSVYATHAGTVEVLNESCEGTVVMISSICNGSAFKSRYSHLGSTAPGVVTGGTVATGDVIGTTDTTGDPARCVFGAHLHYEFRGLAMQPPYIPAPGILDAPSCCNSCSYQAPACTTRW